MPPAKKTQSSPVTRRNRDANVMQVAIEVISEKGYAATSIQEVAERVGVLKGSLYHYFNSKEELLFRILSESHAEFTKIRTEVQSRELPAYEELLEFLRMQADWYIKNPDRANIYFTERRHLTGERRETSNLTGREFESYIEGLVREGQQDGTIRKDVDPRLVSRYLVANLNGLSYWPTRRSGKKFSRTEIVDGFINIIRSGIEAS